MSDHIRLFVGPLTALRALAKHAPSARSLALTPDARLFVLPLTDRVHDELHAQLGTGEWLSGGPQLSSRDMEAAALASRGSALAYLQIDREGAQIVQSAVLWQDGQRTLGPSTLAVQDARSRPPHLWPINMVLRALGVRPARPDIDEATSFGLADILSTDELMSRVPPAGGLA